MHRGKFRHARALCGYEGNRRKSGVFKGARTCTETIELEEYFNVQIKDHELEIEWSP